VFVGCEDGRLDIQAISRNIIETKNAMRDFGQTLNRRCAFGADISRTSRQTGMSHTM